MLLQWYKTDINLFHKELNIIKKEIIDYLPLGTKDNEDLSIFGKIDVDGIRENVLISYPRIYPYSPPKVWLFESNSFKKIKDFQKHFHQNYDESLCLFTSDWGEGSWHVNMDTCDVLDKLKVTIRKARNKEHTDDHTSIINPVPGKIKSDFEIYIPAEILDYIIKQEKKTDILELCEFLKNNQGRILKYPPRHNVMEKIFDENSWSNLKPFKNPLKGSYVKLPFNLNDFRKKLGKNKNLITFLKDFGFSDVEEGLALDFIFLIFKNSKVPNSRVNNPLEFENMISYVYFLNNSDLTNIYKIPMNKVFSVRFPDDIFQRTNAIFDNLVEEIRNKTILIIGLGTLGSYVALEMVKTGIKNLILYDFDIFAPINICRHIGDIKDIGKYKVDIVEDKIKLKNPEAIVKKRACNPFERDEYLLKFIEDLKKTDIVIDTTASYQMNLQLNRISIEFDKTVIFAWCGPNAKSGRVFRIIPRKTPCYYCINLQLEKEPEKFARIKKDSFESKTPQFIGYRQPGIPGISIDINFISLLTSRLTIQTLLNDDESYQNAFSDHYFWQNEPSDLDLYAEIKLIPQAEFRIISRCPICKPRRKKMFNQTKRKEIDEILKKGERNYKKIDLK